MFESLDIAAPRRRVVLPEASLYFGIFLGLLLLVLMFERRFPVVYVHLISEDKIGEYATSVAFALAGGVFVACGRRSAAVDRIFLFFMAFLSIAVAGEEISWGQRIFGIDTPEAIRSINHQGETTIHNIGPLQRAPFHELAGVLLQVLMLTSALRNRLPGRLAWLGVLPLPPLTLWPATLVVSYMLIAMPMVKGDEISEAFLAITVLIWSLLTASNLKLIGNSTVGRVMAVVAALGFAVAAATLLSASFGMNMDWRYNMTATRDYPNAGMMQQSRILFEHIMANPDLMMPETLQNFRRLHE